MTIIKNILISIAIGTESEHRCIKVVKVCIFLKVLNTRKKFDICFAIS